MVMNGCRYLKQIWEHDFKYVLGYSRSIDVRNQSNLTQNYCKISWEHQSSPRRLAKWSLSIPNVYECQQKLKHTWAHGCGKRLQLKQAERIFHRFYYNCSFTQKLSIYNFQLGNKLVEASQQQNSSITLLRFTAPGLDNFRLFFSIWGKN